MCIRDSDGAKALLQDAADELRSVAPGSARAEELTQEAKILEGHSEMMDPGVYDVSTSKAMHYDQYRKHQSRRRPNE